MVRFNIFLEMTVRGNEIKRKLFDCYELERKKDLGIANERYEKYPGGLIAGIIAQYRETRQNLLDVNEMARLEAQKTGFNRCAKRPGAIKHAKINSRAVVNQG